MGATCVDSDVEVEEFVVLTFQWVQSLIRLCISESKLLRMDFSRLQRLFDAGRAGAGNPYETLASFGVSVPAGACRGLVAALASRLEDAERTQEEEMFSGVQIV